MPQNNEQQAGLVLTPRNINKILRALSASDSAGLMRLGEKPSVRQMTRDLIKVKYPLLAQQARGGINLKKPTISDSIQALGGKKLKGAANTRFTEDFPGFPSRSVALIDWPGQQNTKDVTATLAHELTHLAQTRTPARDVRFRESYANAAGDYDTYYNQPAEVQARRGGEIGSTAVERMQKLLGVKPEPLPEKIAELATTPIDALGRKFVVKAQQGLRKTSKRKEFPYSAEAAKVLRKDIIDQVRYGKPPESTWRRPVTAGDVIYQAGFSKKDIVPHLPPDVTGYRVVKNALPHAIKRPEPSDEEILLKIFQRALAGQTRAAGQ
jgi:hypothetical protein